MASDFANAGVSLLRIRSIGGRTATLDGCNFLHPSQVERQWSHFKTQARDLLISGSASTGLCAEVDQSTAGSIPYTGIIIIRPTHDGINRDFFRWFFLSDQFASQVALAQAGTAIQHFGPTHLAEMSVSVPPLQQQRAIADFLDRETARLDALVAAKERFLDLLAEKRRALITRAVTRGLDPSVGLCDSGISWLGELPGHWRSMRLRFMLDHLEQGWSPEADNREPSEDEWGVLKLNSVNQGQFEPSAAKALPADLEVPVNLEIRSGDFLVTRSNTPTSVGDACAVRETRPRLMLSDLIYRLALRKKIIDGQFLSYFLTLPLGRRQIEAVARGTSGTMVKISQDHIKDWWIPLPPLPEQVEIVAYLSAETAKLDAVRAATERTLALLKERRAALITAAVTGQIDIPEDGA